MSDALVQILLGLAVSGWLLALLFLLLWRDAETSVRMWRRLYFWDRGGPPP